MEDQMKQLIEFEAGCLNPLNPILILALRYLSSVQRAEAQICDLFKNVFKGEFRQADGEL